MRLFNGGIYLAKLNPAKKGEISKVRPVAVVTTQVFLDDDPPIVFICPLSSRSTIAYDAWHLELPPRDKLQRRSFALIEHCRAIASHRIIEPRIAQLLPEERQEILLRLSYLTGMRA